MYVFASDVHLSNSSDKRYQAFKNWLISISTNKDISKVFLMGDVFDLWLGDRKHFVNKYQDIVELIFKISKDKEVHIFEGNHDFQMGSFWRKKGVKVHKSFYTFEDEQGRWLLTHGDLLDPADKKYLWLRWFFRSYLCRALISVLPGTVLAAIGNSINTTDQKKPLSDLPKFEGRWAKWTASLHKRRAFNFFVCGHYHFRTDLKTGEYRALNLGSWLGEDLKVLECNSGEFAFKSV